MKPLTLAALLAAFSLPIAASAQQTQPMPPSPQGAPVYGQQYGQQGQQRPNRGYRRWTRLLSGLNLSSQQQQQVQGAIGQYAQSHPAGSPRDPQGMRALRQQIFGTLTPDQQNRLRSQMSALRVQRLQRRLQRAQQMQQNPNGSQPQ